MKVLKNLTLLFLLSRITFPFLIFVSLSSLIGGFLSTINKFAAMAFTPVILNLTIIFTLLYFGSFLILLGMNLQSFAHMQYPLLVFYNLFG